MPTSAKGGVKAHVLLDHDDYLPAYVLLTEAKRSDVKLADSFTLNPGSIVALDRGYTDYALFGRWTLAGVFFVTRMKDNAGTSENALRIQIWTALIALLLLKWLHHLSKANWSLSNLASMLRLNLFTYRELTQWLHNPTETPPLLPVAEQLTLAMT
jgi:hypothetical protein